MIDEKFLKDLENKIIVNKDPFPYSAIENFFPIEFVKNTENDFINLKRKTDAGCEQFKKTKKVLYDYSLMPHNIKSVINFLYSENFLTILEKKFSLKNLLPDWTLHGGGLHESHNGGFLKIHSDFIYMRKSKLKRRLNLLLYLNSKWDESWGGTIEFWDKKMTYSKKTIPPLINNVVIFRTDMDSNHGFPDPITCPKNITRKSLALYYYTKEKIYLPLAIKRRKYFHAVWKKRPNINEPKFGDNDPFFKRLKHKFFYRFF